MSVAIDKTFVGNVLCELNKGLGEGIGGKPGQFCVEQCVSIAEARTEDPDLDLEDREFSDGPTCVDPDLRSFKIDLNDNLKFSSNKDRADALRRIAVAQLGTSTKFNYLEFISFIQEKIDALIEPFRLKNRLKDYPLTGAPKSLDDINQVRGWAERYDGEFDFDSDDDYDLSYRADASTVFTTVIDLIATNATQRKSVRDQLIEFAVEALVAQKTPGSKHLNLIKAPKSSRKSKK